MDDRVIETLERLEAFMATVDDAYALPPEAGRFLHAMVLARAPKQVVEIGTSYGYSGVWIASAFPPGGRLITIDCDPRKHEHARTHFESAGLLDRVDFRKAKQRTCWRTRRADRLRTQ